MTSGNESVESSSCHKKIAWQGKECAAGNESHTKSILSVRSIT